MTSRILSAPHAEKLHILHVWIACCAVTILAAVYAVLPRSRDALTLDNGLLDTLSALLFAAAVLAGVARLGRARSGRPAGILLLLAGLLGLLDEIAAGRWLAGPAPPLLAGVTFHVLLTLAGALACAVGWKRIQRRPVTGYLLLAAGLFACAVALQRVPLAGRWPAFLKELLEANAGFALLIGALAIAPRRRSTSRAPGGSGALPAVVCSAGSPAAVTITQTLGPLGVPIHALSNMDQPACRFSRYTTVCHITDSGPGGSPRHPNVHEPDSLLAYLLEHVERGVLFPGTDANIRFLARHKQALLDGGFRLCIPDEDVLAKAANKSDLWEFCDRHGFPVPRTVIVDAAHDLPRVAEQLRFPIVLKGVFMKNHRFVERVEDLASVYRSFRARFESKTDQCRAVAQEWIPGPPQNFAKLYVVCGLDGRLVAHHTLRRLRVHVRRDGSQGDTLAAMTERVPECSARWLPFFEKIGWVGVASLECKLDPRDGEYKLIEINPRPWAILKVSVDCGVNVPLLYYRLAQGEAVEPQSEFESGRGYIRLLWGNIDPPEPWRTLGMLVTRRIGLGEVLRVYGLLLRRLRKLSIDVGRLRDPWPTLACMHYYGIRYFTRWF